MEADISGFFKKSKCNDIMVKWSNVKTKNIPHISDPVDFEESGEARDNLPTAT